MLVLGIESSCDETAAALVGDGPAVLSDVVASQDDIHTPFGGVVPELASRAHLERVSPVIAEALERAGKTINDLDAVAVTSGPGLVVCLLAGIMAAKGISLGGGVPLIGVNHLDGHLAAVHLDKDHEPVAHPHIGLIVSGGHTSLYLVLAPGRYRALGHTLDDAAGEAFDKVAKDLGLPYPGGREIERLASHGDETAIAFPRPLLGRDNYDFSYSGLKTAVMNYRDKSGRREDEKADIAASFQAAATDVLVSKAERAAREHGARAVVVAGGVAANGRLRTGFEALATRTGLDVRFPPTRLCTDNAAMIALAGLRLFKEGKRDGLGLAPRASWPL